MGEAERISRCGLLVWASEESDLIEFAEIVLKNKIFLSKMPNGTSSLTRVVGSAFFSSLRNEGGYYVDKTRFIREIFNDSGRVSLYTRPRRFGKTLMLSTIRDFLEMDYRNPENTERHLRLFDGLDICSDVDFCREHLGRWPVINLTFKEVEGLDFETAADNLRSAVAAEVSRFGFLKDSSKLSESSRERFAQLRQMEQGPVGDSLLLLRRSLSYLIGCVAEHVSKPVVLLIDEYDVPLMKARENGYYREMLDLVRGLLRYALKDNIDLMKGILSGCYRIAKESVFTGLNNFYCNSVSSNVNSAAFGFTSNEIDRVLTDFGLERYRAVIQAHYDGYHFGKTEIFCPWDVLNFCDAARSGDGTVGCANFWLNTSNNAIIQEFVHHADNGHLELLKCMLRGETVPVRVNEDVSFDELDVRHSPSDMAGLLYATGYLTKVGEDQQGRALMRIPNREIHDCFERKIELYFSNSSRYYSENAKQLVDAFGQCDVYRITAVLNGVLGRFASVRDAGAEAFYHGLVLGLLSSAAALVPEDAQARVSLLASNAESGNGYSDIRFVDGLTQTGVVIELKKSDDEASMLRDCQSAVRQIREKKYADYFVGIGIREAYLYGIAFHGKTCRLTAEKERIGQS